MPIYEYYCPDNNKIYSFYVRTIAQGETIPPCPDNSSFRMVKMVSSFAVLGARRKISDKESAGDRTGEGEGNLGGEDAGPGLDDPRMMAAMAEMERDMAGMDEENPDPRQMARMMRRMSEVTGERFDNEMEEIVRKLEEGCDPQEIEEELGDLMDENEDDDGGFGGGGFGGRGVPTRDPNLYDY